MRQIECPACGLCCDPERGACSLHIDALEAIEAAIEEHVLGDADQLRAAAAAAINAAWKNF